MKHLVGSFVALCIASGLALAQQAPEKTAEDELTKGNTAYNVGKWDDAIDHFTKAYEAWPHPEFLYNIAQAQRQAGNCKQAVYFYKRFLSQKESDKTAPLSAKKKAEIDRFVSQLSDCAAKQDTTTITPATPTPATTTTTTPTQPTSPVASSPAGPANPADAAHPAHPATATTAADDATKGKDDDDTSVTASTTSPAPRVVSVRAVSGVALLSSGDLQIPVQPTFVVSGGYPLAVGPLELDLGAGVAYTPLPYEVMGAQKRGTMLGGRAVIGAVYPVARQFAIRGELGLGMVALRGLEMGNPLVGDRSAKSFTLPNVRVGIAADFLITRNLVATLAPFAVGYSPGTDALYGGSLREIDVLVGIGYRQ